MSLHRLTEATLGVPNVEETVEYYTDFGLFPVASSLGRNEHRFSTVDGSEQLGVVHHPVRTLLTLGIGADDHDDLARIGAALRGLNVPSRIEGDQLRTNEPVTQVEVVVSIAPRIKQKSTPVPPYNTPGNIARPNVRAPSILRPEPVRPRRLGHVAIGSVDRATSQRFFTEGLGFKLSDEVRDCASFLRCSADHHNVVVQQAPVNFLHHTSWEVDDIDEIGRGAQTVLEGHPERHTWGLGRHWVGSNYFYLFRDPAGNFSEYYSDMDEILDDQLWDPGVFEMEAANAWGPPIPPSMIEPEDLAELMAGLH
jgi:catechol 2,3-dioxygenase-like lactoylglutathione lyase family enzyme